MRVLIEITHFRFQILSEAEAGAEAQVVDCHPRLKHMVIDWMEINITNSARKKIAGAVRGQSEI